MLTTFLCISDHVHSKSKSAKVSAQRFFFFFFLNGHISDTHCKEGTKTHIHVLRGLLVILETLCMHSIDSCIHWRLAFQRVLCIFWAIFRKNMALWHRFTEENWKFFGQNFGHSPKLLQRNALRNCSEDFIDMRKTAPRELGQYSVFFAWCSALPKCNILFGMVHTFFWNVLYCIGFPIQYKYAKPFCIWRWIQYNVYAYTTHVLYLLHCWWDSMFRIADNWIVPWPKNQSAIKTLLLHHQLTFIYWHVWILNPIFTS
jgi:hypothetical protein